MEKMFTLEMDEQPSQNTWKQSEVLKLLAVIVAVFVFLFLILTGIVILAFKPSNFVQSLTQNTPIDDQAAFLTFNFQNSLSKSTLANGNFTCSIQNSEHPCSNSIKKWNILTNSALQIQFLESKDIDSVFNSAQLTFDHNNNVIYKVREKYGFKNAGLKAETVFKSKDFDWNQKVSFGPGKKTIMTNESFKNELNDMQYSCPIGQIHDPFYCAIRQPSVKTMTNLVKAVFPTKIFTSTWTVGITPDLHMIVSEYEMIGKLENHTTAQQIVRNIERFDKELTNLCKCVRETSPKRNWNDCLQYGWKGNDGKFVKPFRDVLDTSLCPLELEERIKITVKSTLSPTSDYD